MNHHDLTNKHWARLKPLLRPQKPWTGRPNLPHRRIVNGILWLLRTGAACEALPRRYGKHQTISSRYSRWCEKGIWDRVFADLLAQAATDGSLDWRLHCGDRTVIRAHQHAAGANNSDAETEAVGRSQAGFSTKLNVRAAGRGKPLAFVRQPGQQQQRRAFEPLMEQHPIRQPTGRRSRRPMRVCADNADSNRRMRAFVRRRGIRLTIAHERNERRRGRFDKALSKLRARIEQLLNRLKQFRRIATRYEQRAATYLGMVTIGAILLYL